MNSKELIVQVYVDTQDGVNRWLKQNNHVKVVDIKMSANEMGEIIMVIYNQST